MCVCVCVYLTTPLHGLNGHVVSFKGEFNCFEFRVFLLLDWLPNQG